MYYVNPQIQFDAHNLLGSYNQVTNYLCMNVPGFHESKEFWLFYYVKEDLAMSMNSLNGQVIDYMYLPYPLIQNNVRHAIEAYLDLYNLTKDQTYMDVLRCNARQITPEVCSDKYRERLEKVKFFSLKQKLHIAKNLGLDFPYDLRQMVNDANSLIHPNTFITPMDPDYREKWRVLKNLLNIHLELLSQSFRLLLESVPKMEIIGAQAFYIDQLEHHMRNDIENLLFLQQVTWVPQKA